jgi:DNA-binding GntR family transcriptional regulator
MKIDEERIYRVLARTLLGGRLAPGAQLVEMRLAAIFGVSRERIRKVLQRLGNERLLDLIPNRGAFVASPSVAQAREIYEARRVVEGGIVARLASRLSAAQAAALAAHAAKERAALARGDRALSIRLSGEFHVLLAECTGSPFVVREMQELVSRTSMLVAIFESPAASSCACEEHEEILVALSEGNVARAVKAMHAHLSLIETRLTPRAAGLMAEDAEALLRKCWAEERKPASRPLRKATPPRPDSA